MNTKQNAQAILDLCEAGPIQGGISIKIKKHAQAILDEEAKKQRSLQPLADCDAQPNRFIQGVGR